MALSPQDIRKGAIAFNKITNKVKRAPYKITSAKTDKTGHTPICPTLRAILDEYTPDKVPFCFGGECSIPPEPPRQRFQRYFCAAGMKSI